MSRSTGASSSGYIRLLIVAGIDTTWSAIGSGLWHFAQHTDEVPRLVAVDDDDLLWNTANEEVLRYYAPVTMARKVIGETEIGGCPVHPGDQMLVTFPAANHDPAAFENADVFDMDRLNNRHVAFGLGIHRCVGSNLARLEMRRRPPGVAAGVPELLARHVHRNHVGQRPGPRPSQPPRPPQPLKVHRWSPPIGDGSARRRSGG